MCQPDDFPPYSAHAWYRPPIPAPPTVCAECGVRDTSDAASLPCPGEPLWTEALEPTSASEAHAAAWHQHEEAHR